MTDTLMEQVQAGLIHDRQRDAVRLQGAWGALAAFGLGLVLGVLAHG